MIVSFEHEFIFFPVPRTGTHALRKILRPQLHPLDWEQCILFEKKTFPVQELAIIQHGHITYQQLAEHIFPSVLAQYFKFCLVRDPMDRFISSCYFNFRDDQSMIEKPLEVMKSVFNHKKIFEYFLFQPQHQFIIDGEGKMMMDFVGKYEQLTTDYKQIVNHIGFAPSDLSRENASSRTQGIQEMIDEELKEMVYDFYQKDYEYFGYNQPK